MANYTQPGVTLLRASEPVTLTATFTDLAAATVDPGATTLTVTNDDDTALVTAAAATGTGAVARTSVLTATHTATLDLLTAVWTATTTTNNSPGTLTQAYEVVGDHLFTIAEARAFDRAQLAASATYSDAAITAARQRITEWFESILGVSAFPRYRKVILDGDGSDTIMVPDGRVTAIRAAAIRASGGTTWTALTADELADLFIDPDTGQVMRESLGLWTSGRRNIRIAYEYGHEQVPEPLKYAALKVLTNHIVPSNMSDRTIQTSGEFGTLMLATPNPAVRARWFGLPIVDSILAEYCERVPAIA